MKQIKTIKFRLDNAVDFDEKVNEALADGWTLTKREVLLPLSQANNAHTYVMLYAELEREIITEAERGCENCKYSDRSPGAEPCFSCDDGCNKWEAQE